MLKTTGVRFRYNNNNVTFDFPDVEVMNKESLLLLGKSGIGKTTLLHLLAGLMKPDTGQILINDAAINKLNGRQLDKFRGENIGIIFQQNHFIDALDVIENITLAQTLIGKKVDIKRAKELLSRLGILNKASSKTDQLSQGERQRVAIARAIMNNPKLILADEPTSALDDTNCIEVYKLLQEQANKENAALVIVTHDNRLTNLINKQIVLH